MDGLYVGLISGTSMDGIDAVLAEFAGPSVRLVQSHTHPWPTELAAALRQAARGTPITPLQFGQLDALAGDTFAAAALAVLTAAAVTPAQVRAIGSHGQTLFHAPDAPTPFTLQIGDPNRIAQLTGITTVADFRRRDMAAGGQGAPLVPAFHHGVFADPDESRAVLNVGGIANLTFLPADPGLPVSGYDTGPGNCLLDAWTRRHLNQPFDTDGDWAAQQSPHPGLLRQLLADPYFTQTAPKSTGPEYFSTDWLDRQLTDWQELAAGQVQATLLALTTHSIVDALRTSAPSTRRLLVCGGGVHNAALLQTLSDLLAPLPVSSTAAFGLDPDWVEAVAFAWLARETLAGRPGNLPAVTGASAPVVLGGIYPA